MSELPNSQAVIRAPIFPCEQCKCERPFLGVTRAIRFMGVSRSTVYYWMARGWIHWRLLPSGRRVVCLESLMGHSSSITRSARRAA